MLPIATVDKLFVLTQHYLRYLSSHISFQDRDRYITFSSRNSRDEKIFHVINRHLIWCSLIIFLSKLKHPILLFSANADVIDALVKEERSLKPLTVRKILQEV